METFLLFTLIVDIARWLASKLFFANMLLDMQAYHLMPKI